MDAIYSGQWREAERQLARYDVDYVYVGPNARERYGDNLRSFDRPTFSEAFQNEAVTIYAIDSVGVSNRSSGSLRANDRRDRTVTLRRGQTAGS